MPDPAPTILSLSRNVLRVLIVLNVVFAAAFVFLLGLSFVRESGVLELLVQSRPSARPEPVLVALRLVLVIGLASVPVAHIILTRLLAIVETVRGGDPFVAGNARRLTVIAWALLALQLLDLVYGAIALSVEPGDSPFSGWTFNITGWIAVLLLFVLARVFEQGAAMRDDIEGMV